MFHVSTPLHEPDARGSGAISLGLSEQHAAVCSRVRLFSIKALIKSRGYHSTNDGGAARGLTIQPPAYHSQLPVDMQKLRPLFDGTANIALELKQRV